MYVKSSELVFILEASLFPGSPFVEKSALFFLYVMVWMLQNSYSAATKEISFRKCLHGSMDR